MITRMAVNVRNRIPKVDLLNIQSIKNQTQKCEKSNSSIFCNALAYLNTYLLTAPLKTLRIVEFISLWLYS